VQLGARDLFRICAQRGEAAYSVPQRLIQEILGVIKIRRFGLNRCLHIGWHPTPGGHRSWLNCSCQDMGRWWEEVRDVDWFHSQRLMRLRKRSSEPLHDTSEARKKSLVCRHRECVSQYMADKSGVSPHCQ